MDDARIESHPILEFHRGRPVTFTYEGSILSGFEGEPIAAALHAAGIRVLRYSIHRQSPRGFFCAIGNCSECLMEVDGRPNVKTCREPLREGMQIRIQRGEGDLRV